MRESVIADVALQGSAIGNIATYDSMFYIECSCMAVRGSLGSCYARDPIDNGYAGRTSDSTVGIGTSGRRSQRPEGATELQAADSR